MLHNAKKYETELVKLFSDIDYDPFYDFYMYSVYRETFKIPENNWNGHYFASVSGTEVLGCIYYTVRRPENYAEGIGIVHFGGKNAKGSFVFGKDVMTAAKDIFERFGFIKLKFSCVIGNPVEKTYDKLVRRYGGRIVGIHKNETKLINGKLFDTKLYEITAEEYFASKEAKK
jgi:RimJ/RimL family protein N-acetyltransferase